jgi:glycosyltransferase involved in cell wall biosynthesis
VRLAIVSQQGGKASGAEHALMHFVQRLPADVERIWYFLSDGEFADSIRRRSEAVTIVQMSDRVASAERGGLPLSAARDSVAVTWRLANQLRRARPDVVLSNSMKAHVIGSMAAKAAGIPCLNYIHDIVQDKSRALLRAISGLCAAERLTCSKAVKTHLALPDTSVVYAAIDVTSFAELPDRHASRAILGLPDDDLPVVAMVGRIARWKGQDRFIHIANNVLKQTDAHFCIVGSPIFGCDSAYVDELRAAIAERNLGDRMHLVPWQEDMRAVYAAIDVACNCSVREPFGRTSLEALASGVPVVCFDDAGVCEIFEQHGGATHVPAGDDAAFSAAIRAYLDDPEMRRRESVQARRAANSLDSAHAFEVFADAITRVATRRRKAGFQRFAPSGGGPNEPGQPLPAFAASTIGFAPNAEQQEADQCSIA